jgi:hypothetical protein
MFLFDPIRIRISTMYKFAAPSPAARDGDRADCWRRINDDSWPVVKGATRLVGSPARDDASLQM